MFRAPWCCPLCCWISCLLTTGSALTFPVTSPPPLAHPVSTVELPSPDHPVPHTLPFPLLWALVRALISAMDLVSAAPRPGSLILVTQLPRKLSGLLKHFTNKCKTPINVDLISHKLRPILTYPGSSRSCTSPTPEQYCAPPLLTPPAPLHRACPGTSLAKPGRPPGQG